MRLIDADAMMEQLVSKHAHSWGKVERAYGEAIEALCNAPTVDAVEVVRCKDCIFFQPYIQEMYEGKGDCEEHDAMVYDDDFCSYGTKG